MVESRLTFEEFLSIVKSFHFRQLASSSRTFRRQRLFAMVFGNMEGFEEANDTYDRLQNLRVAHSMKLLGSGVIKVVHRVEDARENNNTLDLSSCQLIQVPDAVYFMMKQTDLTSINLSFNVITKIPSKFPMKFNQLTELNLSNNRISNLPDEFEECRDLETVDISHNSFISLPFCFYSMPKLKEIKASKNFISDVDVDAAKATGTIELLNLEDNPLSRPCLELMATVGEGNLTIKFTSRELEEWEDLSI